MIREKVFNLTHHKLMTKRTPKYALGYTLDDELQVIQEVRAYVEHDNKEAAYFDLLYQSLQPAINHHYTKYKPHHGVLGTVLFNNDYDSHCSYKRGAQMA